MAADAIEELMRRSRGRPRGRNWIKSLDHLRRTRPPSGAGFLVAREVRAFMLDEYVGLPEDHPQRYRNVIKLSSSTRSISIRLRYLGRTGWPDLPSACEAYERAIADAGGVDLQILGIGTDGHIAFNEPGSSLASRTRIKTLTSQTRRDNARFFGGNVEDVPQHCLTQGIGTILQARRGARCLGARKAGRPPARGRTRVCDVASHSAAASPARHVFLDTPRLRVFSSPPTTSRPTKANRAWQGY